VVGEQVKYLTTAQCIRGNAYRLEAKGLWQIDHDLDGHAKRSFHKALRYHHRADALEVKTLPDSFLYAIDAFLMSIANRILEGNTQRPAA
jgi:hypothetical protein